jgi:predicted pyridoxine 5'-phosphate oxidase superfamily flavin-nucleotide-binding protein
MAGPFHDGEIAVQARAGERDMAERVGAGIGSRIMPGALGFLVRQRLLAVACAGDAGAMWVSAWPGQPGFVSSEDGGRVRISRALMTASAGDPVLPRLAAGRDVGMLAIELPTRRRLRINGTVDTISEDEIVVVVRESVANCPKYIQRREPRDADGSATVTPVVSGGSLDASRRALVERVDTVFVGSVHSSRGVDASHRGGAPGFIRVVGENTLRVPDYRGNGMFMTLGNIEADPRASLVAVDFDRRLAVSFSGSARLRFGAEDPAQPTGGTGRYWELTVGEWTQFGFAPAIEWTLVDRSPYNPPL